MSEIKSIKQLARAAVEALDAHGTPPEPPHGLCADGMKEWTAAFYQHSLGRGLEPMAQ